MVGFMLGQLSSLVSRTSSLRCALSLSHRVVAWSGLQDRRGIHCFLVGAAELLPTSQGELGRAPDARVWRAPQHGGLDAVGAWPGSLVASFVERRALAAPESDGRRALLRREERVDHGPLHLELVPRFIPRKEEPVSFFYHRGKARKRAFLGSAWTVNRCDFFSMPLLESRAHLDQQTPRSGREPSFVELRLMRCARKVPQGSGSQCIQLYAMGPGYSVDNGRAFSARSILAVFRYFGRDEICQTNQKKL
eukprot:scaffold7092_cov262-Pinguiococcus_pyrenoidosus.AAC.45